jgi:hypothetical protein
VDTEALRFGWIDSLARSHGDGQGMPYVARRKPKSACSKRNKERVEKLIAAGRMTRAVRRNEMESAIIAVSSVDPCVSGV